MHHAENTGPGSITESTSHSESIRFEKSDLSDHSINLVVHVSPNIGVNPIISPTISPAISPVISNNVPENRTHYNTDYDYGYSYTHAQMEKQSSKRAWNSGLTGFGLGVLTMLVVDAGVNGDKSIPAKIADNWREPAPKVQPAPQAVTPPKVTHTGSTKKSGMSREDRIVKALENLEKTESQRDSIANAKLDSLQRMKSNSMDYPVNSPLNQAAPVQQPQKNTDSTLVL